MTLNNNTLSKTPEFKHAVTCPDSCTAELNDVTDVLI